MMLPKKNSCKNLLLKVVIELTGYVTGAMIAGAII